MKRRETGAEYDNVISEEASERWQDERYPTRQLHA
jgi:hypothetical protein